MADNIIKPKLLRRKALTRRRREIMLAKAANREIKLRSLIKRVSLMAGNGLTFQTNK